MGGSTNAGIINLGLASECAKVQHKIVQQRARWGGCQVGGQGHKRETPSLIELQKGGKGGKGGCLQFLSLDSPPKVSLDTWTLPQKFRASNSHVSKFRSSGGRTITKMKSLQTKTSITHLVCKRASHCRWHCTVGATAGTP